MPEWEPPDDERLGDADIEEIKRFYHGNDGLSLVVLEAQRVEGEGAPTYPLGTFQQMKVTLEDRKPLVDMDRLAQMVVCRAEDFAFAHNCKVQVRVFVSGTRSTGKAWKTRHLLVIDPSEYEDSSEKKDDEEEEDDVQATPATPPSNGHAKHAAQQEQSPPPTARATVSQQASQSQQSQSQPQEKTPAEQGQVIVQRYSQPAPGLSPALTLDPMSQVAISKGLQPETLGYQINPNFVIELYEHGQQNMLRLIGGILEQQASLGKSMESLVSMTREQCISMCNQNILTMKAVCEDAIKQRELANQDAHDLRDQINKMLAYNNAHHENLQKLAQQGWQAFIDGMQMKAEVYNERSSYDRIISGQAIESARNEAAIIAEHAQSSGPSTIATIMENSPAILALASASLRNKSPATAEFLERIATVLATKQAAQAHAAAAEDEPEADDEEEEDDDEEDVVDANYTERGNGKDHGSRPTVDLARQLRMTLSDEQVEGLKKLMPAVAWSSFEVAFTTDSEHEAVGALVKLGPLVNNDPALQVGVIGVLRSDQVQMLMALVDGVKAKPGPRRSPPRPRAGAAATGA